MSEFNQQDDSYTLLQRPALEVKNISKSFGSIQALKDVSFTINRGEVVGLLGDNGAGKSTLVNCISGIFKHTNGQILIDGKEVNFSSPQDSRKHGIETVYQDLAIIPEFDIAANLYLNREIISKNPILKWIGWLDKKAMEKQAQTALKRLNSRIPSFAEKISNLSGGQRQAVSIGRAVNWGADIVVMDEPTAALGVEQSAQVNELNEEPRRKQRGIRTLRAACLRVAVNIPFLDFGHIALSCPHLRASPL